MFEDNLHAMFTIHTRERPDIAGLASKYVDTIPRTRNMPSIAEWFVYEESERLGNVVSTSTPGASLDIYSMHLLSDRLRDKFSFEDHEGKLTLATTRWPTVLSDGKDGPAPTRAYWRFTGGRPVFYTELFTCIRPPENDVETSICKGTFVIMSGIALGIANAFDGIIEDGMSAYPATYGVGELSSRTWHNAICAAVAQRSHDDALQAILEREEKKSLLKLV